MPTSTFFRLPEEKRQRLIEAAWEEFTQNSFSDVSINQIIRAAGIPRGSFYQYFADKGDLFFFFAGRDAPVFLGDHGADFKGRGRRPVRPVPAVL